MDFFLNFGPDFDDFGFLPHAACSVNFFKARPKLKVSGGYF